MSKQCVPCSLQRIYKQFKEKEAQRAAEMRKALVVDQNKAAQNSELKPSSTNEQEKSVENVEVVEEVVQKKTTKKATKKKATDPVVENIEGKEEAE